MNRDLSFASGVLLLALIAGGIIGAIQGARAIDRHNAELECLQQGVNADQCADIRASF